MSDQKKDVLFDGVRVFAPHQNAPDFVIAELVITPDDLLQFCRSNSEFETLYNGKPQFKATIKRSQAGNLYASLNTYKKDAAKQPVSKPATVNKADLAEPEDMEPLPF